MVPTASLKFSRAWREQIVFVQIIDVGDNGRRAFLLQLTCVHLEFLSTVVLPSELLHVNAMGSWSHKISFLFDLICGNSTQLEQKILQIANTDFSRRTHFIFHKKFPFSLVFSPVLARGINNTMSTFLPYCNIPRNIPLWLKGGSYPRHKMQRSTVLCKIAKNAKRPNKRLQIYKSSLAVQCARFCNAEPWKKNERAKPIMISVDPATHQALQ